MAADYLALYRRLLDVADRKASFLKMLLEDSFSQNFAIEETLPHAGSTRSSAAGSRVFMCFALPVESWPVFHYVYSRHLDVE
jgi:hypothetical protein